MFKNLSKFLIISLLAVACKTAYHAGPASTQFVKIDSTLPAKPETNAFLAPYKQQLDSKMNRVIGTATRNIPKGGTESPLGNWMADLQQVKAAEITGKPVDMAVMSDGGLRVPALTQGEISVGDVFELMPFDNELWILTLKGETVQKIFQYMGNRKGLAVSNSQVTFRGKDLEEALIAGKPLDLTKTYTVATSDYLAGGGDGMFFLSEATAILKTNNKLRDVIISYIEDQTKQGKAIEANAEGRVFVK